MQDWIDFVKEEYFETVRLSFVSPYGIMPYREGAQNGLWVMILYHIHLIENTPFLEDLVWQTKDSPFCEKLHSVLCPIRLWTPSELR